MSKRRLSVIACLSVAALGGPAQGHHSITANFDTSREIEIRGEVVDFKLRSPHSSMVVNGFLYVDGVRQGDNPEQWEIESSAASGLRGRGIGADSFRPGDQVAVIGAPHRNPQLRRSNSSNFRLLDAEAPAPTPAAPAGASEVSPATVAALSAQGAYRLEGRWRPPFQPPGDSSALPLNEAGLAAWRGYDQTLSPANTCEPMNIPVVFNAPGYLVEIELDEDQAVVRNQAYDVERRIPLNGASAAADADGHFGMVSGRLEGGSLLIDSSGFRPSRWGLGAATQINGGGADVPSSERKTISERFSASADGLTLIYEYTLFDPVYMSRPHEARVELARVADDAPMFPYNCDVDSAAMFSRAPGESLLE